MTTARVDPVTVMQASGRYSRTPQSLKRAYSDYIDRWHPMIIGGTEQQDAERARVLHEFPAYDLIRVPGQGTSECTILWKARTNEPWKLINSGVSGLCTVTYKRGGDDSMRPIPHLTRGTFRLPSGKTLFVGVVHLPNTEGNTSFKGRADIVRCWKTCVDTLGHIYSSVDADYKLLLGDFNCVQGRPNEMRAYMTDAMNPARMRRVPGLNGIDGAYYGRKLAGEGDGLPRNASSDHPPFVIPKMRFLP